jgi:hypothetical protein
MYRLKEFNSSQITEMYNNYINFLLCLEWLIKDLYLSEDKDNFRRDTRKFAYADFFQGKNLR